jgi:chromate transporter
MTIFQLFWSFFQIGLFSIGGGLAAMPLIQNQIVDLHHCLTLTEFTDLITIAEMTPGPIAINSATFVGIRIAGIPGALVATFACILPSCLIVSFLAWIYYQYKEMTIIQGILRGLRPAVVALITGPGFTIFLLAFGGNRDFRGISTQSTILRRCCSPRDCSYSESGNLTRFMSYWAPALSEERSIY